MTASRLTLALLALGLATSAHAQTPANCNANVLDETISHSTATAGPGMSSPNHGN